MHIKFFCYQTIGYGIFITLNSEFDKAVITQRSAVNDHVSLFDLAKALREDIKGSQLVEVNNAGYGFQYKIREKVNLGLARFIDWASMRSNLAGDILYQIYEYEL